MTIESAKIFDAILRKFEGNLTLTPAHFHDKPFYDSIDSNEFKVENHLKYLIGWGYIDHTITTLTGETYKMSNKGWFKMTNRETEGFEADFIRSDRAEKLNADTLKWARRSVRWAIAGILIAIIIAVAQQCVGGNAGHQNNDFPTERR